VVYILRAVFVNAFKCLGYGELFTFRAVRNIAAVDKYVLSSKTTFVHNKSCT